MMAVQLGAPKSARRLLRAAKLLASGEMYSLAASGLMFRLYVTVTPVAATPQRSCKVGLHPLFVVVVESVPQNLDDARVSDRHCLGGESFDEPRDPNGAGPILVNLL